MREKITICIVSFVFTCLNKIVYGKGSKECQKNQIEKNKTGLQPDSKPAEQPFLGYKTEQEKTGGVFWAAAKKSSPNWPQI